jgi:exodeoxyribonuclease III
MPPFVVASWNVNSLRMRKERLVAWLQEKQPDVVCLQELKMEEPLFPLLEFRAAGYHAVLTGQKTYNGVAILSREAHGPLEDVATGMQDGDPDAEARLITATVPGLGVRVMSAYVPNGQVVGSDKYGYKLRWLGRLRRYLDGRFDAQGPLLVCGDFNVAPDDRDVHDPEIWKDTVICHPEARAALAQVMGFGLHDTLRHLRPEESVYTYWDYRMLAFPKNHGIRIDHILCTAPLVPRLREVVVDRNARKGKGPSDHAPILARFE